MDIGGRTTWLAGVIAAHNSRLPTGAQDENA